MKNDFRLIQIISIVIILSRGLYNLNSFINREGFSIYNLSLSKLWYLPTIVISILVLVSSLIFFLSKRKYAKEFLAISIVVDGAYIILYSLIISIPVLVNSWYYLILGIVIGLMEIFAGRSLLHQRNFKDKN
ncbi:hypothetical protein D3C74_320510 [compost metagenome]